MYLREAAAFPLKRKVVPLARVLHDDSKVVLGTGSGSLRGT